MGDKHGEINAAVLLEQTGWLHALARGLVEDSHLAEELTQDTLLAAVERPPRKATQHSALRAWLARVARNLAFSSAREQRNRAARERIAARPEQIPSVAEAVERTELRQQLMDAILGLDSPYREVVILRYLEGLSTRQVAERTGVSGQAVRTRLSRGLGMLRARLDDEHGGDRRVWMAIVLPLAREGEQLATGGVIAGSGILVAKVLGGLVAFGALAVLAWVSLARLDFTDPKTTSVQGVEAGSGVTAQGTDPREQTEAASARVGDATSGLSREPVQLPMQSEPPTIEMRAELHPGDPDHDHVHRYPFGDEELVLGPPHLFALEAANRSQDRLGFPAVEIRLTEEDRAAFASWTAEIVGRRMAVLLDDVVISAATVETSLDSGTLILRKGREGYSEEDIPDILTRLGFPPSRFEPYTFYGVVVEATDGVPIEDPRLEVYDDSTAPRVLADGLFLVQVENRYVETVRVEADGYAPAIVLLSPGHGAPARAQVIDLVKTASLEVQVVNADGEPVAGAFIRISAGQARNIMRPRWSPGSPGVAFNYRECTTTEKGWVRQEGLTPEVPIHLELFRSRKAKRRESLLHRQEVILSPGERRSIELTFPARRALRGRVIGPRGENLPGVEVQLVRHHREAQVPMLLALDMPMSSSATSDADGRFIFEEIPEGPCHVGVALESKVSNAEGAPLAMLSVPLVLDEVSSSRELTLEMVPALPIGGVVVGAQDEPVEGVKVLAWAETGTWWTAVDTDENGEFLLKSLPPGRYALGTDLTWLFPAGAQIADAGQLKVRLLHVPCTVTVAVADAHDLGDVGGVEAMLCTASPQDLAGSFFGSVGEGQLRREDLPPGSYNVFVRSGDGRVGIATGIELGIEARQVDLLLELSPGVPLEIRLDGIPDPRRFEVHRDRVLVGWGRVRDGLRDVQLVPPGSLRVRLLDESGSVVATREIDAVIGREAQIVFGGQ